MSRSFKILKWKLKGCPLPPPHAVKVNAIKAIQRKFQCQTFVETGTFLGDMIEAQKKNFDELYSIELSEELFEKAKNRFSDNKQITIYQGDSGKVLKRIIKEVEHRSIFWLDGHYSGGDTALGDTECPILEELESIFDGKMNDHVILIDDARCFTGEGDYPKIEELIEKIKDFNSDYLIRVENDIIIAEPGI